MPAEGTFSQSLFEGDSEPELVGLRRVDHFAFAGCAPLDVVVVHLACESSLAFVVGRTAGALGQFIARIAGHSRRAFGRSSALGARLATLFDRLVFGAFFDDRNREGLLLATHLGELTRAAAESRRHGHYARRAAQADPRGIRLARVDEPVEIAIDQDGDFVMVNTEYTPSSDQIVYRRADESTLSTGPLAVDFALPDGTILDNSTTPNQCSIR